VTQRLLIVEPIHGLGNRLRVVLTAMELAERTNRQLQVSWLDLGGCRCALPDLFSAYPFELLNWTMPATNIHTFLNTDHIDGSEKAPVVMVRTGKPLLKMKAGQYAERFKQLTLHPTVAEGVQQMDVSKCIGVHVRRRDFVRHGMAIRPLEFYYTKLDKIPDSIFLCSDEVSVEQAFLEHYGARVQMWEKAEHVRSTPAAIRDALTDLVLLSRTKLIIGTPASSFTGLAAKIGLCKTL